MKQLPGIIKIISQSFKNILSFLEKKKWFPLIKQLTLRIKRRKWVCLFSFLSGLTFTAFLLLIRESLHKPEVFWSFFAGTGTILAIFTTYFLYRRNDDRKQKAQINAVIDEIYHNLNQATGVFAPERTKKEIQLIIKELNRLKEFDRYPNPTDLGDKRFNHNLFSAYENYDPETFFIKHFTDNDFMLFENSAISFAMTTGSASRLSTRLFLHLGHLNFSIRLLNNILNGWNVQNKHEIKKQKPAIPQAEHFLRYIQCTYFSWLHFRLLFPLVDILRTYPDKKIWDQKLLRYYKDLAGSSW